MASVTKDGITLNYTLTTQGVKDISIDIENEIWKIR